MTYDQFLTILNSRGMFRIHPSLDRVRKVLSELGNPQSHYPCIHIAGTNGKGSVAASLESVLRSSGYRTGLYTSPHLVDLRERVKIDGQSLVQGFAGLAEDVFWAEKRTQTYLTYFELLTALAFHAFSKRKVDIAVIECGLGGLWDATNVIKNPLMSIITSVGLDHTQWLGQDEREIAEQKAGIIKPGRVVISGVRGSGKRVVHRVAREKNAKMEQLGEQFTARSLTSSWRSGQQIIRYRYHGEKAEDIAFGLLGTYQADNAALVMTAIRYLRDKGWSIPAARRDSGLRFVSWPGRLQIIRNAATATILLDGAHNPPAMKKMLTSIKSSTFKTSPKAFVFSAFKDKDFKTMARIIRSAAGNLYLCRLPSERGTSLIQLRKAFKGFNGKLLDFPSPQRALEAALANTPKEGLVIVTGSLTLVGEILRLMPLQVRPSRKVKSHV